MKKEKIIEFKNVVLEFGTGSKKIKAIKNVSFDIYKGETFGLVGESGSGKSTIGRAIMGIEKINSGSIFYEKKLIRGTKVDILETHNKIYKKLESLKHNLLASTNTLNDYLNEYKRSYWKYLESKYFVYKTQEVIEYTDGKNRIIKEGVNLKDTKLVTLKKEHRLNLFKQITEDNLKSLIKIIRIQMGIEHYYNIIFENIKISNKINNKIMYFYNNALDREIALKSKINKIYLLLEECYAIREDVINGKYNSIKKFFIDYGKKLEYITEFQKETVSFIEEVMQYQQFNINIFSKKTSFKIDEEKIIDKNILKDYKDNISFIRNNDYLSVINNFSHFEPIKKKEAKKIKKDIQMIFQDPASSLNESLPIEQIISEGINNFKELYKNDEVVNSYLKWHNESFPNNILTKKSINYKLVKKYLITNLLKIVGMLPEHLSRYPHEFSGGQRQRIGFTRALIMKPKLIIADEPISALDVSIRSQVMNLLIKFQKEFGLTYLFIAHDLSVVRFVADRIAVIYRGDIVEIAKSEDLFENPTHPYTKSLLSAIPLPDPSLEKTKKIYKYNPEVEHYDYIYDTPKWYEVSDEHHVFLNQREFNEINKK